MPHEQPKDHTALLIPPVIVAAQVFAEWPHRVTDQLFFAIDYLKNGDLHGKIEDRVGMIQQAYYAFVLSAVIYSEDARNLGLIPATILNFWDIMSVAHAMTMTPRLYREAYLFSEKSTAKKAIFWSTVFFPLVVLLSLSLAAIALSTQDAIESGIKKNLWHSDHTLGNKAISFAQTLAYSIAMAICAATQAQIFYDNFKNQNAYDSELIKNVRRYISRDSVFGIVRDAACALGALFYALTVPTPGLICYVLTSVMNMGQLFFTTYQKKYAEKIDFNLPSNTIPHSYSFVAKLARMHESPATHLSFAV